MAEGHGLAFPDGPRTALEDTIRELVDRAQTVLAAQGRLRALLHANRTIAAEFEPAAVLQRIVDAATELVGAQYGALGVRGPGQRLERFLHTGVDAATTAAIGRLPRGDGLLGELLDADDPIRIDDLRSDPRFEGFPPEHPPMRAFLGVPVRIREERFGSLYLARCDDVPFSDEDEELVVSLAATAAVSIDHARLFARAQRHDRWQAALADVTRALLAADVVDGLGVIVDRVAELTGASLACVVSPAGGSGITNVEHGVAPDGFALPETLPCGPDTLLGRSLHSGAVATGNLDDQPGAAWPAPLRWAAAVPIGTDDPAHGVLLLARDDAQGGFRDDELDLAAEFAVQAGVAFELARGRHDSQELQRIEDRTRIARDLHDHVIQRLFAAGLSLQSITPAVPEPLRQDFTDQVDQVDAAIAEIRTAVFALNRPPRNRPTAIRARVLEVISDVQSLLAAPPTVTFSGAVDAFVPDDLSNDVAAVVRESLTNVGRHADASSAAVHVHADPTSLTVTVEDDGRGIQGRGRASGTANLAQRAAARGGHYSLDSRLEGGAVVVWRVPLGNGAAA